MPLNAEEIEKFNDLFSESDKKNNGYLPKEDVLPFFEKLGIKDNLSEKAQTTVVEGLSCRGEIKITKQILENFYTVIKDQDDLGLLKVCLRGMTEPKKLNISLTQAIELSTMLGIPKTKGELLGPNEDELKSFSFSNLADLFYEIKIPKESSQFDGFDISSKCCLLIWKSFTCTWSKKF